MVLSSTVTPLRPRNYEMETIAKASAFFTHGREAIMLRLFAASHYLDCGEMERARIFFLEAEKLYRDSNLNLAGELLTTFVFDSVVLCHDAAGARAWWDLMESKSPSHFGVDYWLSRSALHWIENQPMESLDAWQNGNALVTNLPDAGAYNFDKDRYALLRGLLNTAPPARPPAIAHHSAPALPLELLPVPAE
jgi:hypothetical protein